MTSKRIDRILVDQGQVRSRTEAQKLIAQSLVDVCIGGLWQPVTKPSEKYSEQISLRVTFTDEQRYVSRAGLKLEAALKQLPENITGWIALDIGQSTGGFTDCLLTQGVEHVVGLEVGHGQLAEKLRGDQHITLLENYNARHLVPEDLPPVAAGGIQLVVIDVSFISQHLIIPNLPAVMADGGWLVSLVKPQFEVGRSAIGKGGIVRDPASYNTVKKELEQRLQDLNFTVTDYRESPIKGGDGNTEFLITAQYKRCDAVTN